MINTQNKSILTTRYYEEHYLKHSFDIISILYDGNSLYDHICLNLFLRSARNRPQMPTAEEYRTITRHEMQQHHLRLRLRRTGGSRTLRPPLHPQPWRTRRPQSLKRHRQMSSCSASHSAAETSNRAHRTIASDSS